MPTMPVGTEFFDNLVSGQYYFVDKTKYIKDFFEDKLDVTLITRPRRFGKTLFLQMLKEFFSVKNAGHKNLFAGLEISSDIAFCTEHQNKYPVIFFTLKEIKEKNFESARKEFSKLISNLVEEYFCCLQADKLSQKKLDWMDSVRGVDRLDLSWETMTTSVKILTKILEDYYGTKPIVLIDEYDTPIQIAWQNGYYNDMIDFMKVFLGNILKTNDALNFAVLTGVLRISKESIFSDLNNLAVLTVTSKKLNKIIGFTEAEVLDLASQVKAEKMLPEIKQWYNGYNFGGAEIYNPLSVVSYLDEKCTPQVYWVNTSGNAILQEMLQQASAERVEALRDLFAGVPVMAVLQDKATYYDISQNDDALFTMLLYTGYLKGVCEEYTPDGVIYELKIPNLEIFQAYRKEILGYVTHGYTFSQLRKLPDYIAAGDAEKIQSMLSKILVQTVSVYDIAASNDNRENFYHGLMLGLSVLLQDKYIVESNWESGYGRFDIALFPRRKGDAGVIMEFKARNKLKRWENYDKFRMDKALEPTCLTALKQIEQNEYQTDMQKQDVRTVVKLGIAFCGKYVSVRC